MQRGILLIFEKYPWWSSFFYRVAGLYHVTLLNTDFCASIFQAFSLLFRNIYFKQQIWATASELYWFNIRYTYVFWHVGDEKFWWDLKLHASNLPQWQIPVWCSTLLLVVILTLTCKTVTSYPQFAQPVGNKDLSFLAGGSSWCWFFSVWFQMPCIRWRKFIHLTLSDFLCKVLQQLFYTTLKFFYYFQITCNEIY